MSKKYRLSLMIISLIILFAVGWNLNYNFSSLFSEFWFTSGLLLLILLSLVDQPFFSKDSNIFVNASTAALSLLLIPPDERSGVFWVFVAVTAYLIICSYILMWLRRNELWQENATIQVLSRINRVIGGPNALFSAFFLWGGVRQFGLNSGQFNGLLWFWIVFMILNVPAIANIIENTFNKKQIKGQDTALGKIFGVQSKNTFLAKLSSDRKLSVKQFDYVEFHYSMDNSEHLGIVLDLYLLDQEQWIKVLTTPTIDSLFEETVEKHSSDVIYKVVNPPENDYLKKFVGLVCEDSKVERIRFLFSAKNDVFSGQLIELTVNSRTILYQVVQGITKNELLSDKNESSYIIGEAIQLGLWDKDKGTFEQFGWVPSINTPIFLASSIATPIIKSNEYVIGTIPSTNYPVILNKEIAVTHHTAILGVTGSGKSVFARNLINQIADDKTKVIIVDLTGEYITRLPGINPIISKDVAAKISDAIDTLAKENAKFLNQRDNNIINKYETIIKTTFSKSIEDFLKGNDNKTIFEISEIFNNASNLEYIRWFFSRLFNVAKQNANFGKRVCVVLEEAHTIVPETTTMGVSDNASKATVNCISQIALQGRKYNIGFVVIAQRTANVSKTILTQCNSIVVFQELDKTTGDFLSNYMGKHFIDILPTLKNRTAIAMGKAFRSSTPMIFEVPFINEDEM